MALNHTLLREEIIAIERDIAVLSDQTCVDDVVYCELYIAKKEQQTNVIGKR